MTTTPPKCPVCGDPMAPASSVACAACATPHHRDCFRYNGLCSVYGCGEEKFVAVRSGRGSALVALIDSMEIGPGRSGRPARLAPDRDLSQRLVVIDYLSTAERLTWSAAVVSGLFAMAVVFLGSASLSSGTFDALLWLSGVVSVVSLIAAFGIEDVIVVNHRDRTVNHRRSWYGSYSMRVLHSAGDLAAVGAAVHRIRRRPMSDEGSEHWRGWLELYRSDGSSTPLGDPEGGPDHDPRQDLQRLAHRVGDALLLPVREPRTVPDRSEHDEATPGVPSPRALLSFLDVLAVPIARLLRRLMHGIVMLGSLFLLAVSFTAQHLDISARLLTFILAMAGLLSVFFRKR